MGDINLMLEFTKNFRNNDYFFNIALDEIRLSYFITNILNPDNQPNVYSKDYIKNGLLDSNERLNSVRKLASIKNIENYSQEHVIELLDYLTPIYIKNFATTKDKKRIELLRQLKELDEEE